MIATLIALSLMVSTASLGDEIEFSRPSLELYEDFLLTRHSAHILFKFEDLRERARSLSVDELHAVRDDLFAIFSHDLSDEFTSMNRKALAIDILSRVLACGLYEKDYDTVMDLYAKFRKNLIAMASQKPATTPNEKGLISTTQMFYMNLLSEMIYNLKTNSDKSKVLYELVIENLDVPSAVVRGVALNALWELIKERSDSVDKHEVAQALSRVKNIENAILEMDISAFQEWPPQGLESTTHARSNLRFIIQQIEDLLGQ